MAAPVIWINALPGTGEDALIKALENLVYPMTVIYNPIRMESCSWIPNSQSRVRTPESYAREAWWAECFADWASLRNVIVVIDFQLNNGRGCMMAHECRSAAERLSRRFIPVYLQHSKLRQFLIHSLPAYSSFHDVDSFRCGLYCEDFIYNDATQTSGVNVSAAPSDLFRFRDSDGGMNLYFCTESMRPEFISQTIKCAISGRSLDRMMESNQSLVRVLWRENVAI